MERLTNRYSDLYREVKDELSILDIDKTEECITTYSEIPSFPGGQFSLFLVRVNLGQTLKLIKKHWDNEYDLKRFSSGIFNLDRLCIKTTTIKFSSKQQHQYDRIIDNILTIPETLDSDGYVTLDGTDYELKINTQKINKKYNWKMPTNEITFLKPLIDFLISTSRE
jgi:hypothetical protein